MSRFFKIHMWPVWALGIFGQAKSFKANPLIGSRLLNRMGLHVIRVLLSHAVTRVRWGLLAPMMTKAERTRYHRDGFLVVRDFIAGPDIDTIKRELTDPKLPARQMIQGNTLTQRILLSPTRLKDMPATSALVEGQSFQSRLFYGGAKWHRPLIYLQKIRNGVTDGRMDPQKTMHSDTFHPTMKAWLFLQDVEEKHGPFTYVKGSNRLTWRRLKWEYQKSISANADPDGYTEKGSLRATPDDLKSLGLPSPSGLTLPAGTLVIANTNGFHGRGRAENGESRMELWAYSRHNPFNFLPGFGSKILARLENSGLEAYWRFRDRAAKRKNSRASWHKISSEEMLKD